MDIRERIVDWLAVQTSVPAGNIDVWLEIPPQPALGDYAFPCFQLARTLRQPPAQIALRLAGEAAGLDFIEKAQPAGGYLNFFLNRKIYIGDVIRETIAAGECLGSSAAGLGKTVIIEFSSPNIAKPFHLGHAFTTVLGHALYRLYDHLGYTTVRMNHLGDYGTQFGKLIVAWRLWGDEKAMVAEPIKELTRIYVKFHDQAKLQPELEDEAREAFRRLEDGAEAEVALWRRFRELSLQEFSQIYERLGIEFDNTNGESFYSGHITDVVRMLEAKGLLVKSRGAMVVPLDEYDLPPCIILKSDGTTIYASRDIAAVLYRIAAYHFYKNIYVVANNQSMHFKQVFAVLEKMGVKEAEGCLHVGYGLVKFPDRKFSTRSGDVVLLADVLNESVAKTLEIIRQNAALRNQDMEERETRDIAEKIGLGAVVYTFLKNGRDREIVFSWDEMLDFDGDTAPYVQYTYARARSILRKAEAAGGLPDWEEPGLNLEVLGSDEEFAVAKLLDGFSDAAAKAVQSNEPYILVRLVTLLARTFNKYYNNEPILGTADPVLKIARLALLQAVCLAIRTGLDLVGIEVVERM
jgi:arginyl-tRNA synthetase